jgi:hypothetical protein
MADAAIRERLRQRLPPEVAALLTGGLVRRVEYEGDAVLVAVDAREFFTRALAGSGVEFVGYRDGLIYFKVQLGELLG